MKFWSVLKLSFHNLANNKLRTFLTVVVLFIMAAVVMLMTGFGMSFFNSIGASTDKAMNEGDSRVSITEQCSYVDDVGYERHEAANFMDNTVVEQVMDVYKSEENIFHTIEFSTFYGANLSVSNQISQFSVSPKPMYMGANQFAGQKDYLTAGRMWNISDENTTNAWVSDTLMEKYELGDTIKFEENENTFTICGFLVSDLNKDPYSQGGIELFIDYKLFDDTTMSKTSEGQVYYNGELVINKIILNTFHDKDNMFTDSIVSDLKGFKKSLNSVDNYDDDGIYVQSSILDELKFAMMMKIMVLAVIIFVSVLIILLSIGSVSNTIKITVEQNRKFFGMMKAIGMQNKTVRRVVQWQAIVMVLIGTVLATGLTIGLMYMVEPIVAMMMASVFGEGAIIIAGLPIYIPFVVFFALVGFVLLFTVKNLNKISKMDVISVISEVN